MQHVDTKTATFSMLEKNILLVVMKEDAVVDLPETKEHYRVTMQLTAGERYAVLVDARFYATITEEAKEFSSNPDKYTHVIRQAIVIESLASRILANFLIQFFKRNKNVEMKLFTNYSLAMNWLKEKIAAEEQQDGPIVKRKSNRIPFLSSM